MNCMSCMLRMLVLHGTDISEYYDYTKLLHFFLIRIEIEICGNVTGRMPVVFEFELFNSFSYLWGFFHSFNYNWF